MNHAAFSANDASFDNTQLDQADSLTRLADGLVHQLHDLQGEIERATGVLDSAPLKHDGWGARDCPRPGEATKLQIDVRRARKLRDVRKRLFGRKVFSGPGWEILLRLFETHLLQQRDTVGSVCDGTELPATTALRWISRLETERFVRLRDDPLDARRIFVELSDTGIRLMTNYFSGAAPNYVTA